MSALGEKIDEFKIPICNSFRERFVNDQLCYELDVNEKMSPSENDLKLGLTLIIDENKDRQYSGDTSMNNMKESGNSNVKEKE